MFRMIFKYTPLALALYAVGMFASASTIAQLSSASGKQDGIWVQLCASGARVFLALGGDKDDPPMPGKTHAQACHACGDERKNLKHPDEGPDDGDAPNEV